MTWFATDDGFPEHPKVDRLEALSAGDWSRYAAARMVWHDMGCDCARRLTDGAFLRVRAHRVCRLPREVVDVALADLVGAGLILAAGDGFAFHDWSAYQPTRAKVEAMRASKTERQRRWRERVDASTGASTNASTASSRDASTGASTAASRDASVDAAPSPPHKKDRSSSRPTDTGRGSGADAPLLLLPDAPKDKAPDPVAVVFAHWQTATGKARAVLDAKRRAAIERALKLYPVDTLCRAVDGYAASPWHRGENDRGTAYLGLELMLRDAAHIDAGCDLADKHAAKRAPSAPPPAAAPPRAAVETRAFASDPDAVRGMLEFGAQLRAKVEERRAAELEAKAARARDEAAEAAARRVDIRATKGDA